MVLVQQRAANIMHSYLARCFALQSAAGMNNMADALAAKYGGVSKGSGSKKRKGGAAAMEEPSEEEFAAAQQRMAARMAENKAPAAGSSKASKGSKGSKSKR